MAIPHLMFSVPKPFTNFQLFNINVSTLWNIHLIYGTISKALIHVNMKYAVLIHHLFYISSSGTRQRDLRRELSLKKISNTFAALPKPNLYAEACECPSALRHVDEPFGSELKAELLMSSRSGAERPQDQTIVAETPIHRSRLGEEMMLDGISGCCRLWKFHAIRAESEHGCEYKNENSSLEPESSCERL
jgi:hypothetical protein